MENPPILKFHSFELLQFIFHSIAPLFFKSYWISYKQYL
ncbi:hypothetical protein MANES_03G081216v8 [Manihot esculenta]|uniref:Uncharacterized protein n=1 Tax=Manihot esculenta TaxID=3983 RepID=A0ACB7I1A3_MANES|nr:hypothetical protein MANES_03G081216v8 [Manihot esculenta]